MAEPCPSDSGAQGLTTVVGEALGKVSCGPGSRWEQAAGWGRCRRILRAACAWDALPGLASCLHCRCFLSSCQGLVSLSPTATLRAAA